MRWTEGHIHVAMRRILANSGWTLIAGEFPGGSDHELYPLNITDPAVARDNSPTPRHHSTGELIPDLVALKGQNLFIGEAKVRYDEKDRQKLATMLNERRSDLILALNSFAILRGFPELIPISNLVLCPTLIFSAEANRPVPDLGWSHLRIISLAEGRFEGSLAEGVGE
jgi:hypothetical protein